MRATVLQHVPFEGPGVLAARLTEREVDYRCHLVPQDGIPHDPGDLLIVMGGPMSVNDPDPWIAEETAFIKSSIERGKPVLGVCLGSQFMAKALGAQVVPGRGVEIGMTQIRLTGSGKQDSLFRHIPETFDVFEWHGEIFELPEGAISLASSDMAPVQAFRYGSSAYGLLFHLEIEQTGIEALCRECANDLARANMTPSAVLKRTGPHLPQLHECAFRLLDQLLQVTR